MINDYPAHFLLGFYRNHGLLQLRDRPQWKTIPGGSKEYVRALCAPFANRIRKNCPVSTVTRDSDGVTVTTQNGESHRFDQVVLACHGDQAFGMLSNPTQDERRILGQFKFQPNNAVLHSDTSVLPKRRSSWASWNYFVPERLDNPASVTYDLRRLQNLISPRPILLTLNPVQPIDPESVIRSFIFTHPIFDRDAYQAQQQHSTISGVNRVHFCGAYWRFGFHEDGVRSALNVARYFNKSLDDLVVQSPTEYQLEDSLRSPSAVNEATSQSCDSNRQATRPFTTETVRASDTFVATESSRTSHVAR